jgi:hypothetical protein
VPRDGTFRGTINTPVPNHTSTCVATVQLTNGTGRLQSISSWQMGMGDQDLQVMSVAKTDGSVQLLPLHPRKGESASFTMKRVGDKLMLSGACMSGDVELKPTDPKTAFTP